MIVVDFSRVTNTRLTPTYLAHLHSPEWLALRARALVRANHRCEECGCGGRLDVHHLHYRTLGHERLSDVQVLCRDCHEQADAERRLDAWATKVYGKNWAKHRSRRSIRAAFDRWLERKGVH